MGKQWKFSPIQKNVSLPGMTPVVAGLLAMRGICTEEEMEEFLSPTPKTSYDPFAMLHMEEASELVLEAIDAGSLICVFGDYDADGVSATTVMLETIEALGGKAFSYIPSRFEEGYGLSSHALEIIAEAGAELIVTVDCGVTAVQEADYARELGIELLITDHHTPGVQLPDAILLNPKQPGDGYPERNLCGAGVAFKLAQALAEKSQTWGGAVQPVTKAKLHSLMDVVAVATVGDIVALTGENRSLVKYGLRILNQKRRPGLMALAQIAHLEGELAADAVAFGLVPRLNAAGRVGTPDLALQVLLEADPTKARELAEQLDQQNTKRKQLQEETLQQALAGLNGKPVPPLIMAALPNAHEGILGIAAGRLKEIFGRPALVMTQDASGNWKGSGRAPQAINLYQLLAGARDRFSRFGGHRSACGFAFEGSQLESIKEQLTEESAQMQREHPDWFEPCITVDWVLQPEETTLQLVDDLHRLEPYGTGNEEPLFALLHQTPQNVQYMGTDNAHARFTVSGITCVLFRVTEEQKALLNGGSSLDIAGVPVRNVWKERETLQFRVAEIRSAQ